MRVAVASVTMLFAVATAQADDQQSSAACDYFAPLTVSAHVDLMVNVGKKDRAAATEAANRLATFLELTERMACDVEATRAAINCVTRRLTASAAAHPTAVAGACLEQAAR